MSWSGQKHGNHDGVSLSLESLFGMRPNTDLLWRNLTSLSFTGCPLALAIKTIAMAIVTEQREMLNITCVSSGVCPMTVLLKRVSIIVN